MKTLKTTLTNLIIYTKPYPRFLNVILLIICILFFDNCRQRDECEGSPKSNSNFDSTHFDSSEKSKIPDWQGDSLYFYSDVGDTAYMYCDWQSSPNGYEYFNSGSNALPCPYSILRWYPSVLYSYHSNEPTLNGLRIHIYKESNANKWVPNGPPVARVLVGKIAGFVLSEFGGDVIPNDSVRLENGKWELGSNYRNKLAAIRLKVGLLKINPEQGKNWTLYKYRLNN